MIEQGKNTSTRIVVDSTAGLNETETAKYRISTVPLAINFVDKTVLDNYDLVSKDFYDHLAAATKLPSTSQPPTGAFVDTYRKLASEGAKEIISVHISGEFSGTVRSAQQAAEIIASEGTKDGIPAPKIQIIDSRSISMGHGFLALVAAEALAEGASPDEAVARAKALIPQMNVLLVVDTFKYLRMGGRIGAVQALAGTLLDIKPIIEMKEGKLGPLERVRTRRKALERLVGILATRFGDKPIRAVAAHANTPEEAALLAEQAKKSLNIREITVVVLSPVVGIHGGPGVIGLAAYPLEK